MCYKLRGLAPLGISFCHFVSMDHNHPEGPEISSSQEVISSPETLIPKIGNPPRNLVSANGESSEGTRSDSRHRATATSLQDVRGSVKGEDREEFTYDHPESSEGTRSDSRHRTTATSLEDIQGSVTDEDRKELSYKEIEALWRIRQSPLHNLALEEWQRKEKELNKRAAKRIVKSQDLHTQLHNIIGWFAVFQGVVLTAVSQLTQTAGGKPLCGKTWFPIVLTGLGTVVTIIGVIRLFSDLKELDKTINSEKKANQETVSRARNLIRLGPERFSFKKHAKNNKQFPDPGLRKECCFLTSALCVFTAVFILSYFVILCDKFVATRWNKHSDPCAACSASPSPG